MDPEVPHREAQAAFDPELDGLEGDRAFEAAGELGLDLLVEQPPAGARPDQVARERTQKKDARQEQAKPASTHPVPPAEVAPTLADGSVPIGWIAPRIPLELPAHGPSFRITATSPMRVPGTHVAALQHFFCGGSRCADGLPKIAPTS